MKQNASKKIKIIFINKCPKCGCKKWHSRWALITYAKCGNCEHIWQYIRRKQK